MIDLITLVLAAAFLAEIDILQFGFVLRDIELFLKVVLFSIIYFRLCLLHFNESLDFEIVWTNKQSFHILNENHSVRSLVSSKDKVIDFFLNKICPQTSRKETRETEE